ncbi:flap endonuclease 1 [Favolaschia claudopus]|uniref:Flap endonuclease 1 n=1 Tax=Favolaschia claudopus TaxID=2862362 RepID=A0AAW0C2X6_9AGAR
MAQNPPYRSGFVVQPQQQPQYSHQQQPYDPRNQYPQYQPRQPAYPQYQQPPQHQYYPQYYQQPPPPQSHPYTQPQQHPQYAQQPPPPRPRSSLGHAYSHSVPVAPGQTQFVNPPPLSPSALQAQAAQAQMHARARAVPPPRRADTLPPAIPAEQASTVAPYPQQQQYNNSLPNPVPLNRSASSSSTSASSRPLPVPTPSSSSIPRPPAKHQSIDLGRFSPSAQPAPPQPVPQPEKRQTESESPSQIRRRASPPRFTGGSGSWSEPPPIDPLPKPSTSKATNAFKDLLSGQGSALESGKFVPLWKRGLITNGETSASSSGRPLPSTPAKGASTGLKRGGSLHVRAPATASTTKSPSPSPEPSSESEDESDDEEHENEKEQSAESESEPDSESQVSDSEDASSDAGTSSTQPVSPTYGIRDLPRPPPMDERSSTVPQPPQIRASGFEGRSAPGVIEGGGSRTLMFAAASLKGTPVKNSWPASVPPLPRTPALREIGDLEDSPPVSTIRRGPVNSSAPISQPASRYTGPSSPLSKTPSVNVTGPPAVQAAAPIPSLSFTAPTNVPSTSKIPAINLPGPSSPQIPTISFPDDDSPNPPPSIPQINLPGDDDDFGPTINVQDVDSKPAPQVFEVPGISFAGGPTVSTAQRTLPARPPSERQRRGLACGGCGGSIVGRIVNAMNLRWHPECFKCSVCNELLEHVSSYERDGRAYCHLDYHENFAPRCYSCKTAIVEERFISLDDPQLGRRTYHEQHFFCAECGDPFLPPSLPTSKGEIAFSGDGAFVSDDVGFTVFRGHPYCEACHVRLRLPKCKKCKRSIRDADEAVEALGGKWCWGCFTCAGCDKPFDDPSFFERDGKPWCEPCFSIILRNEL